MNMLLPTDALRVQNFLTEKKSNAKILMLPESTATAQEAAEALQAELFQIGKSVVFKAEDKFVVALVCGNSRVDPMALSKNLSLDRIEPARADEVKKVTGFVIGGVSPFALPTDIIIVIDTKLYKVSDCYVAAGHPKSVVLTSGKEIKSLTNGDVFDISQ